MKNNSFLLHNSKKALFIVIATCYFTSLVAQIRINSSNNLGIGTSNPENSEGWNRVLDVYGTDHAKSLVSTSQIQTGVWSHNSGYYGAPVGGFVGTASNHPFSIVTNKGARIIVQNVTPYCPWIFSISGSDPCLYATSNYGVLGRADAPLYQIYSYSIWLNGWLTISSDERLKTNIKDISGCLQKIKLVKGVSYDLNSAASFNTSMDKTKNLSSIQSNDSASIRKQSLTKRRADELEAQNKNRIGFLAQQLMVVYPELVRIDSSSGLYSVDYIGMIPILTNAVNELQSINEQQDSIIKSKDADIVEIKSDLVQLQKQMADIEMLLKKRN